MNCSAARIIIGRSFAGVAAGIDHHDDRVVADVDRRISRSSRPSCTTKSSASDVGDRMVARVEDGRERDAARAGLL